MFRIKNVACEPNSSPQNRSTAEKSAKVKSNFVYDMTYSKMFFNCFHHNQRKNVFGSTQNSRTVLLDEIWFVDIFDGNTIALKFFENSEISNNLGLRVKK